VRARAAVLRQGLPPPAPEPARTEPGPTKEPAAPGTGSLLLSGDEGVRVQIDKRAGQAVSDRPIALPPGKHRVCYLGGCQDVAIAAGATATLRVPTSLAEQLLADADAALRDKDVGRALALLERARRQLLRSAARPSLHGDLQVLLGRAYEQRSQWREAMAEYGRFQKLPANQHRPESTAQVKAAIARLAPRMGRIQIFTMQGGRCQVTDAYYLPPGEHIISLGGGRQKTVQLDAGVTTPVRQCQ
jgi:tetratricopeptide (TPR) repeat protein